METIQVSKVLIVLAFLLNFENSIVIASTKKTSPTTNKTYLKKSCDSTRHPKLCYSSLSPYMSSIQTNDLKLCNAAMTVTLKAASDAQYTVRSLSRQRGLKKSDIAVIKDCQFEIGESKSEIRQSLSALRNLKRASDKKFQIDNMKTWMSAAITDATTCIDGFDGMNVSPAVKNKIKKSIAAYNKLASNALALINKLN